MSSKITLDVRFLEPKAFRYFWLKYVQGFKPDQHCARCLIGPYSKHFPYGSQLADKLGTVLDEAEAPFIYICGVTGRYENNVHLVGRPDPQSEAKHKDDRVEISVHGLSKIEIIPPENAPALGKEFLTCRNWQFGWQEFPDVARQASLFSKHQLPAGRSRSSSRPAKGD